MKSIIKIQNMNKVYKIYDSPMDRLKEALSLTKKVYSHEYYALKEISIEVKKGESIGLLGTNGSGKSTLLKIITGVLNPTNGNVEVNGKVSALLELGAGFNPEYTGIENIYLNGSIMGYSREDMENKIESIIEFADIGEFINQPVKTYSSGMFARLAFAVAINVEPEILIVDEALSVGDAKFQIKCIEKMEEIKKKGTTILFVTHATEQVRRFCERAIWIEKGILKKDGDVNEVADIYENFLVYGSETIDKINILVDEEQELVIPQDPSKLARIIKVDINNLKMKTFEEFIVDVTYEVYQQNISDFLLGVAIYTPKREYIFGPNTYLEKVEIPNNYGVHKVRYSIKEMPLLSGIYNIDVGLFNQKGLVCIDYRSDVKTFTINSNYSSEGMFYIEHEWEVLK